MAPTEPPPDSATRGVPTAPDLDARESTEPPPSSHTLRVTSESGLPFVVDVVRLLVGGQDARPAVQAVTPFEVEVGWDVDAEVLGDHDLRFELVRCGSAVLIGTGRRVVLSQSGRGDDLEARLRAYDG